MDQLLKSRLTTKNTREATRRRVPTKHTVGGDRLQAVVLVWVVGTVCLSHQNELRLTFASWMCLFYFRIKSLPFLSLL